MAITIDMIKELRQKTACGVADCKEALTAENGDMDKATVYLRKKGLADIKGREQKISKEGVIGNYVHMGDKIAVLVEINCETDFVAKSDTFKEFAHNLAMHVAAANPRFVSRDQVPQEIIDREKEIILPSLAGKPQQMVDKIVSGKLSKVFKEICLLEQPFVKEPTITISDLLGSLGAKIGEKIVIKKFVRFVVGE